MNMTTFRNPASRFQSRELTSNQGSHLLPSAETALHSSVMARNIKKTWYGSPAKTPTPGLDSKTFTQETMNSVVPKLTDRVMDMLPTTYNQPQTQEATRLHFGGDNMKAW